MAEIVNTPEEGNAGAVTAPDDTTPEEYRGKSLDEVIAMHQNANKKIGQMSEEVGSLRKIAETVQTPQQDPGMMGGDSDLDEVDFYTDPMAQIRRVVQQEVGPLKAMEEERRAQAVKARLDSDHPGWVDTVKDSGFQEWVAGSKVRTNLFVQADAADFDAAHELLSTWSELSSSKANASHLERKAVDRDRKLRAATTETKGAAGIDSRKILNRADLRSLRQNNPTRYNELLPDIKKAYADGRVR